MLGGFLLVALSWTWRCCARTWSGHCSLPEVRQSALRGTVSARWKHRNQRTTRVAYVPVSHPCPSDDAESERRGVRSILDRTGYPGARSTECGVRVRGGE